MNRLHSIPNSRVVSQQDLAELDSCKMVLVRSESAAGDEQYGLHVRPRYRKYTGSLQIMDLLHYFGFLFSPCSFIVGDCYARRVRPLFDLNMFARDLPIIYGSLQWVEECLTIGEYRLDHHESRTFVNLSGVSMTWSGDIPRYSDISDSLSLLRSSHVEDTEDQLLRYVLALVVGRDASHWIIHCHPKETEQSDSVESALRFLGLRRFDECQEFDFHQCYRLLLPGDSSGVVTLPGDVQQAHERFAESVGRLSECIGHLLSVQAAVSIHGMSLW